MGKENELGTTELLKQLIDGRVGLVDTALIAKVTAFNVSDNAAPTVNVKPIHKYFINDELRELPELMEVPLLLPGSGQWMLTTPVAAGDSVLIVITKYAFDIWAQNGASGAETKRSKFSLSNAIAIAGLHPANNPIASYNTNAMELRNTDGSAKMTLDGTRATFSGDVIFKSEGQDVSLSAFYQDYLNHTHP